MYVSRSGIYMRVRERERKEEEGRRE